VADPARLDGVHGSLALVRHGESVWVAEDRFQGQSDPPLSSLGERQAALVGARLADPAASPALPLPDSAPIGIWHSPLKRAASTAAAIASGRAGGSPLHSDPRLMELAQGKWEGLTNAEVTSRYGVELEAWRHDPLHHWAPDGESILDGSRRMRGAIDDVVEALRTPGAPQAHGPATQATDPVLGYGGVPSVRPWVIVAAHDGILRLALLHLIGVPLERYWSFPFALCAVTVVEISGGRARLRAHNLAEHLAALALPALAATDRGGAL
jgi:broad specificity phosphatase PhoE